MLRRRQAKFLRKSLRAFSVEIMKSRTGRKCLLAFLVVFLLTATPVFAHHSVNINTANIDQLKTLTGIGDVKAQAVIDYRNAEGPFAAIEDVQNVSGIGPATFADIKDHITVGGGPQEQSGSQTEEQQQTQTQTSAPTTSSSSSGSIVRVTAGSDRVVIVGVDARFEGAAYDAGNHIVEAQLRWNFGDGTSALGRTAIHRWEYPGRYAVVLEATRFGEVVSQRITVSAEEAQIGFSLLPDGGVLLENNSTRDTDLSNWRISNRGLIFTFPSNTIVLRGSSIRLSPMALHFSASAEAGLLYPNGDVAQYAHIQTIAGNSGVDVDVEEDVALTVATSSASSESSSETPAVLSVNEIDDSFDTATEIVQSEDVASVPEEEPISESESTRQVAAVATDVDTSSKTSFVWWFGAILVMGLGTIAVSLAPRLRRRATSSASNVTHVELKDWNIIEDIEETR